MDPDCKIRCDYDEPPVCPATFTRAIDMERHKEEKHGDPKKCPFCSSYSARRSQRLLNHIDKHHRTRGYTPRSDKGSKYKDRKASMTRQTAFSPGPHHDTRQIPSLPQDTTNTNPINGFRAKSELDHPEYFSERSVSPTPEPEPISHRPQLRLPTTSQWLPPQPLVDWSCSDGARQASSTTQNTFNSPPLSFAPKNFGPSGYFQAPLPAPQQQHIDVPNPPAQYHRSSANGLSTVHPSILGHADFDSQSWPNSMLPQPLYNSNFAEAILHAPAPAPAPSFSQFDQHRPIYQSTVPTRHFSRAPPELLRYIDASSMSETSTSPAMIAPPNAKLDEYYMSSDNQYPYMYTQKSSYGGWAAEESRSVCTRTEYYSEA